MWPTPPIISRTTVSPGSTVSSSLLLVRGISIPGSYDLEDVRSDRYSEPRLSFTPNRRYELTINEHVRLRSAKYPVPATSNPSDACHWSPSLMQSRGVA